MSLIKCPYCGTKYSDSYDECPFCDEEEEQEPQKPNRKPPKTRQQRRGEPGRELLSPILIVILVLLLALLGYLLFGGGGSAEEETPNDPAIEEPVNPEPDVMPEIEPEPEPEVVAPTTSVALDLSDFTLNAGEPWPIEASGGSGEYTWSSADATVATVTNQGIVTAVGGGNTIVTATDGFTTAECIVRVKGASVSTPSTSTSTTTSGTLKLSHSDVSIVVGETFKLSPSGVTTTPSYASENASFATVSDAGIVTGVAKGTTNITVTIDGQSAQCIVRVN